jgi:arylsulfatase
MDFAYEGGGVGKGGLVTLLVNGEKVGEGRVERTQPYAFSVEDGADVGVDTCTPVIEDYQPAGTRFTGTIRKVVVDVKAMTAGEKADAQKALAEGDRRRAEAN